MFASRLDEWRELPRSLMIMLAINRKLGTFLVLCEHDHRSENCCFSDYYAQLQCIKFASDRIERSPSGSNYAKLWPNRKHSFNASAIYVRFCARLYVHSAGQIRVERSCRNGSYRELYLEYYIFPDILAFHLNRTPMHTNLQSANKKEKRILHWKMGVCANTLRSHSISYDTVPYCTRWRGIDWKGRKAKKQCKSSGTKYPAVYTGYPGIGDRWLTTLDDDDVSYGIT